MRDPEVTADGISQEGFSVVYAEAKRLIVEDNDLEGARRCLSAVMPASEASLWQWTDLLAALLFHQGRYEDSRRVLAAYESRYPGLHDVTSMIQMLRQKSPDGDAREQHGCREEVG